MKVWTVVMVLCWCIVLTACGKTSVAKDDIDNLIQALKLYKLDNERYPASHQGLTALVSKPDSEPIPVNWKPYLVNIPKDPWGSDYIYEYPGSKGTIDIRSYGEDKKSSSDDIVKWIP